MNEFINEENQGEPIADIIRREYLPFWPIVLGVGLVGLLVANVVMRYMQPEYSSQATIMFKDNAKNQTQQVLSELVGVGGQGQDRTKQNLEILQGYDVAMDAIKELGLNAQLYSKGRVTGKLVYKGSPSFNCIFFNPDSIRSFKEEITFVPNKPFALVGRDTLYFNTRSRVMGNELLFSIDASELKKLRAGNFELRVLSNLSLKRMFDQVKVVESKSKPSVDLVLNGEDPIMIRDILTNLLKSYAEVSIQDNRNEATNTIAFIEDRLVLIEGELDSVESGIERFKQQNPMVSLNAEAGEVFNELRESDKKMAEIGLQQTLLTDIENYIQGKGNKPGMMPSFAGMQFGQEIQQFLIKLYDAELEHEKIKSTSAERSEQYRLSLDGLQVLRGTIAEFVVNVRKNLKTIEAQAKREANRYTGIIDALPKQERVLFDISRQQVIKNQLFRFLLEKREESAIRAAAAVADLIVLEPPSYSSLPINIKPPLFYTIGFMGGIGVVLLSIFLVTSLNNKLVSREQVELLTKIPVVGTISYQKDDQHLVMTGDARSLIAEQFRALRTNIGYYQPPNKNSMVIVVTSSIPGEGKSFNAANLALSLAMTGSSTLLVESDLRKPNISKHFNLNRSRGLSTYLVGKEGWADLVQATEFDSLSVFSSGPIPPNPVELIMNGRYAKFLEEAQASFKYIVIDCPPVGVVTDGELIAAHADLMLFVTRYNHTPKNFVEKLLDKYNTNRKITQTGIIFNGMRPKGLGYYGSKYGYKYGYGYGYGYGYYSSDKGKHS